MLAYGPRMRILDVRMRVRLTTLPEAQSVIEQELAALGVPWTYWPSTQRWPGGERKVLELELYLPRPGAAIWPVVDRMRASGVWLAAWMDEVSALA